jgi:hypothetical protein
MRLAPLAERPVFGWKYQYTLPVGLLRIIKVYGGYTDLPIDNDRVRYQIEGGRLLTDEDGIEILYIERPVSAATMPYHFVDAVVAYLAYLMAIVITSSEQITALMARESERQIEAAKRMDAQQNYAPEEDGERWYTEAR